MKRFQRVLHHIHPNGSLYEPSIYPVCTAAEFSLSFPLYIHIAGYQTCPYFQKACRAADGLSLVYPSKIKPIVETFKDRQEYQQWLSLQRIKLPGSEQHTTCPIVWQKCANSYSYIGGCDAFMKFAKSLHLKDVNNENCGKLQGKSVIVTGGAGGIGKVIALTCLKEGAKGVIVIDRTETPREGGLTVVEASRTLGMQNKLIFVRGDVANKEDIQKIINIAVKKFGRLDIYINNAAIGVNTNVVDCTEEDFEKVMRVNCKGVFLGCKFAITQMLKQNLQHDVRGRIVNISSQHGMIASPGDFAYGVGKATVVYMTKQIACDFSKKGIIINAVAPGKIQTGKGGDAAKPHILAYSQSRTPYARLGRSQDVANAVVFLASDAATYIAGENLMVDGGWMAS